MAYDWGNGLAGAGSGAGVGASIGGPWGAAIGGGLGLLSGFGGGGKTGNEAGNFQMPFLQDSYRGAQNAYNQAMASGPSDYWNQASGQFANSGQQGLNAYNRFMDPNATRNIMNEGMSIYNSAPMQAQLMQSAGGANNLLAQNLNSNKMGASNSGGVGGSRQSVLDVGAMNRAQDTINNASTNLMNQSFGMANQNAQSQANMGLQGGQMLGQAGQFQDYFNSGFAQNAANQYRNAIGNPIQQQAEKGWMEQLMGGLGAGASIYGAFK